MKGKILAAATFFIVVSAIPVASQTLTVSVTGSGSVRGTTAGSVRGTTAGSTTSGAVCSLSTTGPKSVNARFRVVLLTPPPRP